MTDEQFVPLAQAHIDMVFRVAYSYLKSHADADDVTQDVLIQLYKTETAFESNAHIKNWLIRVTVNRCKMLFRSPWRRVEALEDYAETLGFETPEYSGLFTAVMRLDRKYRVPIYLYYYEGYTTREIAGMLHLPENTVSTRLRRGRDRLREQLTEAEEND